MTPQQSKTYILNDYTAEQLREAWITRSHELLFLEHGNTVLGERASHFADHVIRWQGFEDLLGITVAAHD